MPATLAVPGTPAFMPRVGGSAAYVCENEAGKTISLGMSFLGPTTAPRGGEPG